MKHDSKIHHRKSIRLKNYDYSQSGLYVVTICVQNRLHFFGEIVGDKMVLNDAGGMVKKWFYELENKFSDIKCHQITVMPNHTHFIVQNVVVGADLRVCPDITTHGDHTHGEHIGSPLHRVVQWFKTMTTNGYIRGVNNNHWQRFNKKLWQRNYWEHIIRNDNEYNRIAQYIIDNPQKIGIG